MNHRDPTFETAAGTERAQRTYCQLCVRRTERPQPGYGCSDGLSPLTCFEVKGYRKERVNETIKPVTRETLRLKKRGNANA